MARYVDKSFWEEEVLIPDTNTPVLGGQPAWEGDRLVDGFYNVPVAILSDRTRFLRNRVEGVEREVVEGLDTKVDKEAGKGLSQENYTTAEKDKLANISPGATDNIGTVTSVEISVPTGLSISGSPITTSGTLEITYSVGYSIPANTKQGQWDTAYGWGNHALAGYALASSLAPIATTGSWDDILDKPTVIAAGSTQADARTAIGAGTSNLVIGTIASTAKEGDWQPTSATKEQVLEGTSTTNFVSSNSYSQVISWEDLGIIPSGMVTIDLLDSLNFKFSVGGNVTIEPPQNSTLGKSGDIVITMTANGSVSWDSDWKFLTTVPDIGDSGEIWVISYKVLSSSQILASANKIAD